MRRAATWAIGGVLGALIGCRKPEVFTIRPGVEPAGTCAIEGYITGRLDDPNGLAQVALYWHSPEARTEGGLSIPVTLRAGRFRLAGIALPQAAGFTIAARLGDRGALQHSTLGGNVDGLFLQPRDRAVGVRLDVVDGAVFRGQVLDAAEGTPVAGLMLSAERTQYGRWGWQRPGVFAITDADGRFTLAGVNLHELPDAGAPRLRLYHARYGSDVFDAQPGRDLVFRVRRQDGR